MATESFADFLNKLKDIHEKEVCGLQMKLNELTNERCRDTQRIEELFAKNHQLREQQKLLKENVKVLENRLRAGLCDRCQVTQELAKKKQHEFGKAHFQSLQHIFILTNEMNKMREENRSLKEELRRLCGTEERPKSLKGLPGERSTTPDSPLPLVSTQSRKSSPEKTTSQEAEDECSEPLGWPLGGDEPPEQRSSPCTRISPDIVLQGEHALELSSQRIANQLHGTIALLRPGSRSCSQERDGSGSASPPPASKTPPSPQSDQSLSFEAYLRASKSDCHEIASSYETLKIATRKEQLSLLNQHFALRHLGLQNNSKNQENSFPHNLLMARELGSRTRSQDEWDDPTAILELPGAVVYMKDRHLGKRLQFLNSQEKFQYLLMEKQQQEYKARIQENLDHTQCQLPSPLPRVSRECKNNRHSLEESSNGIQGKLFFINREDLEQEEKAEAVREYLTEAPLDLSDSGRGRESLKPEHWPQSSKEYEVGSQNEESSWFHELKHFHGSKESEKQLAVKSKETNVASLISLQHELPASHLSSCDATANSGAKMSLVAQEQMEDQEDNKDSQSMKEESEPDISGTEMIGTCEDDCHQEPSMNEKYCCLAGGIQHSQKKRKRGPESWAKAHAKSTRGKQNGQTTQDPADLQESVKETTNHSPVFRHGDNEET